MQCLKEASLSSVAFFQNCNSACLPGKTSAFACCSCILKRRGSCNRCKFVYRMQKERADNQYLRGTWKTQNVAQCGSSGKENCSEEVIALENAGSKSTVVSDQYGSLAQLQLKPKISATGVLKIHLWLRFTVHIDPGASWRWNMLAYLMTQYPDVWLSFQKPTDVPPLRHMLCRLGC